MKLTKWLALFLCAALLFTALYAVFNMLVDPFGVFGDRLLGYGEYSMTENPRVAKMAYLENNHDKYDSYIVGCSKTSSYSVDLLNRYMDASFFNLFAYGGDMADEEKMITYVIENYSPKNIIVAMGPEAAYKYDFESDSLKDNLYWAVEGGNPVSFYAKYAFLHPSYSIDKLASYFSRGYLPDADAVFNVRTGAYNKTVRDSIPIGSIDEYLNNETSKFQITHSRPLKYIDECVASVKRIKELCDERGVNFMLIASPLYSAEQACYSDSDLTRLWTSLADVTDFYDFIGYNSVSSDIRYFYDGYHFRNCVGDMALAYMFGDDSVYVPDGFGFYTTKENVSERINAALTVTENDLSTYTERVPILMYHNLSEESAEGATVSTAVFEEHIKALSDAGYTSVFYEDLINYVESGIELPEKPVVITFDDGYESNISLAAPILEKYGMCATVAIVGVTEGAETYKDSDAAIIPHFSLDDERLHEYMAKGILDIQTHTYDMHQVEKYDGENCREGALMKNGESEESYVTALTEDISKASERIKEATGKAPVVYTYPYGKYSSLSEVVVHSLGMRVTVTTDTGVSEIVKGIPQSLYLLKRFNMTNSLSGESILQLVGQYNN